MKAGSLSRNTLAALGQAIFVSVLMFLVFRIVIQSEGLEEFGIWSLLMTGSTLARAGDISGAGGLGRFIAMARNGAHLGGDLAEITRTVLITSIAINIVVGLLLYFFAPFVLRFALSPDMLNRAVLLLPYLVTIIVVGGLAAAIVSGIDGTQRIDQRALVVCSSAAVTSLVAIALVPRHGLAGFGLAQISGQVYTVLVGWAVLRHRLPEIGWFPHRWHGRSFRMSTAFGLKLNGISLLTLLFEPLVKFAFGATGGPSQVALYELASRVVTQIRGFAVAASMSLIPTLAALRPHELAQRDAILRRATTTAAFIGIASALAALVLLPVMSIVVLGEISGPLLVMSIPLIFAWTVTLCSVPLYLAAQTDGRMRWNGLSHLIMAAAVIVGALLQYAGASEALLSSVVVGILLSAVTIFLGNVPMLGLAGAMRGTKLAIAMSVAALVIINGSSFALVKIFFL